MHSGLGGGALCGPLGAEEEVWKILPVPSTGTAPRTDSHWKPFSPFGFSQLHCYSSDLLTCFKICFHTYL